MRVTAGLPPANPALAASRIARLGGHALEAIGKSRFELRGVEGSALRRARADRLRQVCEDVCRVHGFRMNVSGVLPRGPVVLVSNHLSYVDAPVLGSLAASVPIAKGEIASWPILGAGSRSLGVIFVQRGDAWSGARALRQALRALEDGVSVLGFPEGTTTHGDGVLDFRRGLFGIARIARVPVVPIAISYESPELCWVGDTFFLPHYLRTAMRPETVVDVRIGSPVSPYSVGSTEDLAQVVRARIGQMIRRPQP